MCHHEEEGPERSEGEGEDGQFHFGHRAFEGCYGRFPPCSYLSTHLCDTSTIFFAIGLPKSKDFIS